MPAVAEWCDPERAQHATGHVRSRRRCRIMAATPDELQHILHTLGAAGKLTSPFRAVQQRAEDGPILIRGPKALNAKMPRGRVHKVRSHGPQPHA